MSNNKIYYYMKLNENFYEREDIKILQNMKDGYLYTDILIKLTLKSLKHEGRLMFKENIPYDFEMISIITDHDIETVKNAINIFKKFKWVEILDNGAIYILDIQDYVGAINDKENRNKIYREKIENEKNSIKNSNNINNVINDKISNDISNDNNISNNFEENINCEKFNKNDENKGFYEGIDSSNNELNDAFNKLGQNWDICPPEKEIEKEIKTETETETKTDKETDIKTEIGLNITKEKKKKYSENNFKNNNIRKNEILMYKSCLLKEYHDLEKCRSCCV